MEGGLQGEPVEYGVSMPSPQLEGSFLFRNRLFHPMSWHREENKKVKMNLVSYNPLLQQW